MPASWGAGQDGDSSREGRCGAEGAGWTPVRTHMAGKRDPRKPLGAKLCLTTAASLAAALALGGCDFARYHAKPLAPLAVARKFQARRLDAPTLAAYVQKALAMGRGHHAAAFRWPPRPWTPRLLVLAALFYSPRLAAARAQLRLAEAGIQTAAERPNPSASAAPGYETFPEAPWALKLAGVIPIETAGRRQARVRRARRLARAARWQAAEAAWQVRARVRAELLALLQARRAQALAAAQAAGWRRRVRLLRAQLAAGEIARPVVAAARLRWAGAEAGLRAAQGRRRQARIGLAAAIGVPAAQVAGLVVRWRGFTRPPPPAALGRRRMMRLAVRNRMDLRASLADYAAAQAGVRLQIARQYPDINLGPGWTFEEAQSVFSVAVGAVLPVFNHNQGPIAQALAARRVAAAAFLQLQARDRAAAAAAWAAYRTAWESLQAANAALVAAQSQRRSAAAAQREGETGRLRRNQARLGENTLARARWRALAAVQAALGQLESAVERPLTPAWKLRLGKRLGRRR